MARCYICYKVLEVVNLDEHNKTEPCDECLEAIDQVHEEEDFFDSIELEDGLECEAQFWDTLMGEDV